MDLELKIVSTKKRIRSLYGERYPHRGVEIEVPDFNVRLERLTGFLHHLTHHRSFMIGQEKRRKARMGYRQTILGLGRKMASGERIMAIDVERSIVDERANQIGWAYCEGGDIVTANYNVEGRQTPNPKFDFGSTETAPIDVIRQHLIEAAAKAAYFCGHSIVIDFETLKTEHIYLPRLPVFDTAQAYHLSIPDFSYFDGRPKMVDVAKHFGIETPLAHCAGNDARYTLEIVKAIVARYSD